MRNTHCNALAAQRYDPKYCEHSDGRDLTCCMTFKKHPQAQVCPQTAIYGGTMNLLLRPPPDMFCYWLKQVSRGCDPQVDIVSAST